jgi:hypothetical protein
MSKTKFLTSILLAMAVLFAQVGMVAAAPQTQDTTPITGTIESIVTETDANNVTTVLVTFVDEQGATQTVRLDLTTAAGLELVDETTLTVNDAMVGQSVTIDPATVIPDEEPAEEDVHPIAEILAKFFDEDPSVVNEYHMDGFGFGVIAQAMWMSRNLTGTEDEVGDASLAGDILQAKRDKDYETFFQEHEEFGEVFGDEIPSNWGQFKKVLKEKKNNLGTIVSGQADESTEDPALQENPGQQNQGNDKHDKPEKQKKPKKQKKH